MTEDRGYNSQLKGTFDISHFDLNAVLRGVQLTLIGAHRALQNPALFTSKHYKQAALAVAAGIVIRLVVAIPALGVRALLWMLSFLVDLDAFGWDDSIITGLIFVEHHVLQLPIFLMTLMRHLTPTLDETFLEGLRWVDVTYMEKHKHDPNKLRDLFYPNLRQYPKKDGSTHSTSTTEALSVFCVRFVRKGIISLAIFAGSYIPGVGRFVLPAASLLTFKEAVGLGPASILFGTGLFLPRRYMVIFLQTYFSSRGLMRELLEPYFARIHMTKDEKKKWFRNRGGLLFGFGIGFYTLLRVPLLGVLIYGIAEASTAYLITKISDPPPPPAQTAGFAATQVEWRNKQKFLSLPLEKLDALLDRPPSYSVTDTFPKSGGDELTHPESSGDRTDLRMNLGSM